VSIQQEKHTAREGEEPGPTELSADEVYDLLSNQRRRFVLYHLRNAGETSLRDLSRLIAAWENDVDPEAVTSVQRKRVYTALHQTHLMRLDEYDVVEYDESRGTVVPTANLEMFVPFLAVGGGDQRSWERYYLGVGAGAGVLTVGAMLDLPVLAGLDAALVALALTGAILATAWVQRTTGGGRSMPEDLAGLTPESPRRGE